LDCVCGPGREDWRRGLRDGNPVSPPRPFSWLSASVSPHPERRSFAACRNGFTRRRRGSFPAPIERLRSSRPTRPRSGTKPVIARDRFSQARCRQGDRRVRRRAHRRVQGRHRGGAEQPGVYRDCVRAFRAHRRRRLARRRGPFPGRRRGRQCRQDTEIMGDEQHAMPRVWIVRNPTQNLQSAWCTSSAVGRLVAPDELAEPAPSAIMARDAEPPRQLCGKLLMIRSRSRNPGLPRRARGGAGAPSASIEMPMRLKRLQDLIRDPGSPD